MENRHWQKKQQQASQRCVKEDGDRQVKSPMLMQLKAEGGHTSEKANVHGTIPMHVEPNQGPCTINLWNS